MYRYQAQWTAEDHQRDVQELQVGSLHSFPVHMDVMSRALTKWVDASPILLLMDSIAHVSPVIVEDVLCYVYDAHVGPPHTLEVALGRSAVGRALGLEGAMGARLRRELEVAMRTWLIQFQAGPISWQRYLAGTQLCEEAELMYAPCRRFLIEVELLNAVSRGDAWLDDDSDSWPEHEMGLVRAARHWLSGQDESAQRVRGADTIRLERTGGRGVCTVRKIKFILLGDALHEWHKGTDDDWYDLPF